MVSIGSEGTTGRRMHGLDLWAMIEGPGPENGSPA